MSDVGRRGGIQSSIGYASHHLSCCASIFLCLYAGQAYSPCLEKYIEVLEAVQCRAVPQVWGLHGSYKDKLKQCRLTILNDRRLRGDLIQYWPEMTR